MHKPYSQLRYCRMTRLLLAYCFVSADLGQLVALVALGSPHHFPAFMPHRHLRTLLMPPRLVNSMAAVSAASVPQINVLAGVGDYSLPLTHASAATTPALGTKQKLSIGMDDMPGVWTTASHKVHAACVPACQICWGRCAAHSLSPGLPAHPSMLCWRCTCQQSHPSLAACVWLLCCRA